MAEPPDASRQQLQTALDAVTASFSGARPVSPVSAAPAPAPSVAAGGKQELVSAFDKLVEHEATKSTRFMAALPPIWRRLVRPAIIAICLSAALYFTMARPAWLYPRFEAPSDPASIESAQRMLVATSLLLKQYQQQYGNLPTKMTDVRGSFPAVSMSGTAIGGFQLFSTVGTRSVVMTVEPGRPATVSGGKP